MSADLALQGFIKELLENSDLTAPVYDNVPQDTDFPYVSIGESSGVQVDDSCGRIWQITHTINVFSRYDGFQEVKSIQGVIDRILSYVEGEFDGYRIVIRPDSFSAIRDGDGTTRQGSQTFVGIVSEIL